jgi:hypothetical protein
MPHYHPDIRNTFVPETFQELNILYKRIKNDIDSGDLEVSELNSYYLRNYSILYGEFQLLDAYKYQVILNYSETESYLNKKVSLIYDQIRCLQSLPVVTTLTNTEEYYWAHPLYNIIAVPPGEEKSLLNLPDLFHEIAHFIFEQYGEDLIEEFLNELKCYYDEKKREVDDEDRGQNLIDFFSGIQDKWEKRWVEEFACDMIGTYLTGAAYGWTNLKIASFGANQKTTYEPFEYHPSDEARMRGIFAMLNQLGLRDELQELEKSWDHFLGLINVSPKNYYDDYFPQELIESLAQYVYEGCQDIDIASYNEQRNEIDRPVSLIINEAWEKIREHPEGYNKWENKAVEEIKSML